MKNKFALSVAAAVCAGLAASASPRQTMLTPPKVLVIAREVVKTGKSAPHEKWETGWPHAFSKANWPVHSYAQASCNSAAEKLGVNHLRISFVWNSVLPQRQIAEADLPLAGLRGFSVTVMHVKPGHGKHFEEIRKLIRAAHEKAGLAEHYSVRFAPELRRAPI